MLQWISMNLSTIVILAILIGVVALVTRKMIRDKRAGKTCGCGGGCAGCAGASLCHAKREESVRN